jgi:predicted protein tyrosine phosphatase
MKILFICTANMERSPTAEMVFRDVPGWLVKSAGTSPDATVPVTRELIDWADRVLVMQSHHMEKIIGLSRMAFRKTLVLGVEDIYYRCSPQLIGLLIMKMGALFPLDEWIQLKFNCQKT